ncbi:Hsp20 family protein [Streptomyces griseosporeus]|uniref:Hsp20 family protein n=1 Tax=Streptomyces griseosporeus TaxID=1910 RepID=UPI0036CF2469
MRQRRAAVSRSGEFQDLYDRMGRLWQSAVPGGGGLFGESWAPPTDLEETDDAYLVEVDLPGLKKDDITIELNAGELAVHGEIKERNAPACCATVPAVPAGSATGDAAAGHRRRARQRRTRRRRAHRHHRPKAEKAKPRRIEITSWPLSPSGGVPYW